MEKIYTVYETADILKVGHAVVRRLIDSGDLSAIKVGGQWRVRESDISSFLGGNND